ncbi:MAG: MarR family transcriptional regulator [Gelidibacter sp.]|nr:MarR family transcriptional regulator [Gelidibacter sp.]
MKELEDILKTKSKIPLVRKTVLNIMHSNVWIKDNITSVLKPFDISVEQFNVLRILRGQKGNPTNLQDIQDRMISKMSNTTRLVDKLILKGYVERFTCEKNRRKVDIFITKSGLDILNTIDPIIDSTEQLITSHLTNDELETLNHILTKLRDY